MTGHNEQAITQQPFGEHILIVHPPAALDNNNAHEMVDVITTAQTSGYRYIILDMTDVEFLSSAGVGSILGTVESSRERGGDIILCNLAEPILHILGILDLGEYLTIHPNQEAALARCGMK